MLSDTLNTNEVKDAAGTVVGYQRIGFDGRTSEFALIGEAPALEDRFSIKHAEIGTGINKRRRSTIRFDKTLVGDVDNTVMATDSAYVVLDTPIGNRDTQDNAKAVLARLMSLLASIGTNTTIKYDGTGNGAVVLLTGSL